MTNLSAMFAEQQTSKIEWDGPLFSLYDFPVEATRLIVEFDSVASAFRQGLRVKVRGGELEIDGVSASDFALWQDTAPSRVKIDIRWGRGKRLASGVELVEHNGVMHAWLGNSGMRVEEVAPGRYLLRCSDGEGEPTFDDLVAGVTVE